MPSGGAVPSHASSQISKVLVANRGEIAVRVIRGCQGRRADQRGGVRRARRRRPARAARRRGVRARRTDLGRVVPRLRQAPRRGREVRRRRDPPRLRLPLRERRLRAGRHRRRPDLDRPEPAVDPRPRRQGHRPPHRRARQGAAGARHPRPGEERRRGRRVRQGVRPADRDQGGLRRRWPRHEGGPHDRGDPGAVRVRDP